MAGIIRLVPDTVPEDKHETPFSHSLPKEMFQVKPIIYFKLWTWMISPVVDLTQAWPCCVSCSLPADTPAHRLSPNLSARSSSFFLCGSDAQHLALDPVILSCWLRLALLFFPSVTESSLWSSSVAFRIPLCLVTAECLPLRYLPGSPCRTFPALCK